MTSTANETTIRTDVLVIGAGQAGLAAGYHLQRLGVAARIVEADARARRKRAPENLLGHQGGCTGGGRPDRRRLASPL